jgi:hypothetical protein
MDMGAKRPRRSERGDKRRRVLFTTRQRNKYLGDAHVFGPTACLMNTVAFRCQTKMIERKDSCIHHRA